MHGKSLHISPSIREIWRKGLSRYRCRQHLTHDDVIKWTHFPCYRPFIQGIHRWLVNSPHKGQWREALIFSLICDWITSWVNNREVGDLRRHRAHYDVIVMWPVVGGNCDNNNDLQYTIHNCLWKEGQSNDTISHLSKFLCINLPPQNIQIQRKLI